MKPRFDEMDLTIFDIAEFDFDFIKIIISDYDNYYYNKIKSTYLERVVVNDIVAGILYRKKYLIIRYFISSLQEMKEFINSPCYVYDVENVKPAFISSEGTVYIKV